MMELGPMVLQKGKVTIIIMKDPTTYMHCKDRVTESPQTESTSSQHKSQQNNISGINYKNT